MYKSIIDGHCYLGEIRCLETEDKFLICTYRKNMCLPDQANQEKAPNKKYGKLQMTLQLDKEI